MTATAVRALKDYAPMHMRTRIDADISRAAAWLKQAKPDSTQERVYQLLGLRWTDAGRSAITAAGRALLREQRRDGGWSQLPTLESDAYATGEVLVALLQSGVRSPKDTAIRRGVQFLLSTQLADGSWFVQTRAIPIQPYFDAGFPHGQQPVHLGGWDELGSAARSSKPPPHAHRLTDSRRRCVRGRRVPRARPRPAASPIPCRSSAGR